MRAQGDLLSGHGEENVPVTDKAKYLVGKK